MRPVLVANAAHPDAAAASNGEGYAVPLYESTMAGRYFSLTKSPSPRWTSSTHAT